MLLYERRNLVHSSLRERGNCWGINFWYSPPHPLLLFRLGEEESGATWPEASLQRPPSGRICLDWCAAGPLLIDTHQRQYKHYYTAHWTRMYCDGRPILMRNLLLFCRKYILLVDYPIIIIRRKVDRQVPSVRKQSYCEEQLYWAAIYI